MKIIQVVITILLIGNGLISTAGNTNIPVLEFMNKSVHISSGGRLPAWDKGFRKNFDSDFGFIANQLDSDLANVKLQGESSGKANFKVEIYINLMYDCKPCSGVNAISTEWLSMYLEFIDPVTMQILYVEKIDNPPFKINGEPEIQETVNRTWSEFLRTFIKDKQLKEIINNITHISGATLSFRPKDGADEKPMKADGKKKGVLKISDIKTGNADHPVGEKEINPLTEFELSCKNGLLIDKTGQEVNQLTFKGNEFVTKRDNFEFDYVVYNCDDHCDKSDDFTLTLKSQNGVDLTREIKVLKEEFACYGYTISLEYTETNDLTGTTNITASWDCVKIDFGNPKDKPVEMNMNAAMSGQAIDYQGNPLLPPYTIPMNVENGLIHVNAPIKNNIPSSCSISSTGGVWSEFAESFKIDFTADNLTIPPDIIWVKKDVSAEELCGSTIPQGVYLEWQFDIWGEMPELGYSQLFQSAASCCTLTANRPNSMDARVPDTIIPLMKDGKAFTYTISNERGSYTISGTPQQ